MISRGWLGCHFGGNIFALTYRLGKKRAKNKARKTSSLGELMEKIQLIKANKRISQNNESKNAQEKT
jgi:hypothetical protein